MIFALSTGHKIGLAGVGAAFIVFALISSLVLPARIPNFPGRYRNLFMTVTAAFFAAMIAAVIVFGREAKGTEAKAASNPPPAAAPSSGGGGGGATQVQGNPTMGAVIFKTKGCSGCHTLKAAGATGTVGPNLDTLKPAYATIVHQVINGGGAMPPFKGSLTMPQIDDVAAYVYTSTH